MAARPAIHTDAGMAGRQARPELTRCTERLSPLGLAAALASADPSLLLDMRTPQNGTGEPWSDLRCPVIFFYWRPITPHGMLAAACGRGTETACWRAYPIWGRG